MTFRLTSRPALTALIAAFLLHNVEEAITICRYPVENPFPATQPANCYQFLVAVSILSFAGLVVYIFAMRTKKIQIYNLISTGLASVLLLNVLMPHIFVAIYTLHYTPGLVSAVILNLPLSLIVLIKNRKQYLTKAQFFKHIFIGCLVGYLFFAAIMRLVFIVIN